MHTSPQGTGFATVLNNIVTPPCIDTFRATFINVGGAVMVDESKSIDISGGGLKACGSERRMNRKTINGRVSYLGQRVRTYFYDKLLGVIIRSTGYRR
jgi:hypothetical protein